MRDFLKYTFASLIGSLVGIGILLGLGTTGLIFLIVAAASRDTGPKVEDKSLLVLDLSLNITDTQPTLSTSQAIEQALSEDQGSTITLREVLDAIAAATQDSRITGIYLQGSSTGSTNGYATLKEVREALAAFRAAGKTIVAYDEDWTEREYYLGSVANTVITNPLGLMEINGLSAEIMFLTGAFQKYGIGVQVTRAGKYKAAVEPFIRNNLSPENRAQTQQLLSDVWGEYLRTIGEQRKLNSPQLQAIADNQGILLASEALQQKLVDRVVHFDEVITELKELTQTPKEDDSFRQISLPTYAKIAEKNHTSATNRPHSDNRIAVVYAEGEIVDGEGGFRQVGGERLARELREKRLDDKVKAVVLRVNSPGGSATASEVIGREVELLSQAKPVVVSMGDIAASGGYWISMFGQRIFAEPNTITGSIGVFGLQINVQQLANNNGISWDVVKTGRYADSDTVSRPKTVQEMEILQRLVDRIYDRFITKVADSRKLPKTKVAEIAQGRVWSGTEGQKNGLVDEIGGLEKAILAAADLAKLGEDWQLEEYSQPGSWQQQLLEKLVGDQASTTTQQLDPLSLAYERLKQELTVLSTLNDPGGIYMRLPYNFLID